MEQKIRPMLALNNPVLPEDLDPSSGPWWVSPKLDGIRSLAMDCEMRSRTLKLHPNLYMRRVMAHPILHGLDGELTVGPLNSPDCINSTTSGINTISGEPVFQYNVFDRWDTPDVGFKTRIMQVRRRVLAAKREGLPVSFLPQILCNTIEEVRAAVDENYAVGYEGSIIRSYNGRYKYNRSTMKDGLLLKVKESIDFEIHIIGFEEMYHNENEAKLDERGYTKRSTHKAGKVPAGTLGKLIGISVETGETVTAGRGKMTAEEALHVWTHKEEYFGSFAKVRSGKHGVKDKPRFPRFVAWRDASDM